MNEKIMVIDDDELVRSGLAANLERVGFDVLTAANSQEVRAHLSQREIDLAICDLVLGNEDGMDVLRYLQAQHPGVAVIIITGHGSVRTALDSLRGGASDYIQKPADPDEVIHRVRMVLDSVNMRRTLMQERQKSEERKRMMSDQLNRAERMSSVASLADGTAKDLKEILGPFLTAPDEVRKQLDPLHDSQALLIGLDGALQKTMGVVRDLENIGQAGNIKTSPVQMNHLVDACLKGSDCRPLFELNPMVKLETNFSESLPPFSGSATHLRQMMVSLIAHAVESMPTGGALKISTSVELLPQGLGRYGAHAAGEYVVLRIEDTAAHLSEEDMGRIFEPFYIRNQLGRRFLPGLGLTMAYRVVEEHGGFIDLRNANHTAGNIFEVYFPVRSDDDAEVLELRADYTGGERLLLVEDSDVQRAEAEAMMQELGYEVTSVASGQDAIDLIKQRRKEQPGLAPFDLLVIDLVLGDLFDGVDTYKHALALVPGLKAIMVSGFADITRIVEARKLGVSRTFQKPYSRESLGKNIRLALDD
jgi:two-component system cell cycle sensor histidine kinase/response regulator CckA